LQESIDVAKAHMNLLEPRMIIYLFKYTSQERNNRTIEVNGMKPIVVNVIDNLYNLSMKKWEKRTTINYSENLRLMLILCLISSLLKLWLQTESWSPVGNLLNSLVARIKNDFCLRDVLYEGV
jgi:phosphotransferase system  glucose/maltose/N-acetylglucosamine-specific IIC component